MLSNVKNKIFLETIKNSLFGDGSFDIDSTDVPYVFNEARAQAVLPLAYKSLEKNCDVSEYSTDYYKFVTNNIFVRQQHSEIHKLLSSAEIPYVIIKGCASADYYPEPILRTMGDVDLLIKKEDLERTDKLLKDSGFSAEEGQEVSHRGYCKSFGNKANLTVEVHWTVNGIPECEKGRKYEEYLSDIIDSAVLINNAYMVPSDLHHGLILLLHTSHHLISEGIGLRHICDWAAFVSKFSNEQFIGLFEKPLKETGLWRFAQILTCCCVKYLGCSERIWTGEVSEELIDCLMSDILSGGNFGKKDINRYQQIKYINNRESNKVSNKGMLSQLISSINRKSKFEYEFASKYPFFLPIAWVLIMVKYLFLIVSGKRKLDNSDLLRKAKIRKNIYAELKLFENE